MPRTAPTRRAAAALALLTLGAGALQAQRATPAAGRAPASRPAPALLPPPSALAIAPSEYATRRAALATALAGVALPAAGATAAPAGQPGAGQPGAAAPAPAPPTAADSTLVVVALGAPEPRNDYETFSQAPDFQWLTGFSEPDAALVYFVRGGQVVGGTLFVPPSDPSREVWTGKRAGVDGARAMTGLATRPNGDLRAVLDSLAAAGHPFAVVGDLGGGFGPPREVRTRDEQLVDAIRRTRPSLRVVNAAPLLYRLRGKKSPAELARIRRAVDVTVRAHQEALGLVAPGLNEFEVQALIEYTFRRNGAERPSFATIVGSGPNSTTLHYNADDRVLRAGEVVVMDIGASYAGYAADVTRTLPVSGRFTDDQKAIYQLVRDAQKAAEQVAVPGARWSAPNDSARVTIARGLARLGLATGADSTYDCGAARPDGAYRQCPQWSLYYMHGLGHGIGLEVHDPEQGIGMGALAEGSAFTLEPGVYVRERLLDIIPDTPRNAALKAAIAPAVKRYANVGVRIEDDYVIENGRTEWISRAPREIAEIERLMAAARKASAGRPGAWRGPAARDRALVEGYVPR